MELKSKVRLLAHWKILDVEEFYGLVALLQNGGITRKELEEARNNGNGHKKGSSPVVGACPECGGNLVREGGCETCYNCNYAKCG